MEHADDVSASRRKLEEFYRTQLRQGELPGLRELKAFCSRKNLPWPGNDFARDLKFHFLPAAVRTEGRQKKKFASASFERFGLAYVDLAFYLPKFAKVNDNYTCFLVCVESLSSKCAVCLMKSKSISEFRKAFYGLLVAFDFELTHILCDREASLLSEKFRQEVRDQFGITFLFQVTGAKAVKSERLVGPKVLPAKPSENFKFKIYSTFIFLLLLLLLLCRQIRYLKRRLSIGIESRVLQAKQQAERMQTRHSGLYIARLYRWVDLLKDIVAKYNSQTVPGTTIVRRSVNRANSHHLLQQLLNARQPRDILSMNTILDRESYPADGIYDKVFKYSIDDLVLLKRKMDYTQKKNFAKATVEGDFGRKVYKIYKRVLRTNRKLEILPMYGLAAASNGKKLLGLYYPADLIPAKFAPGLSAGNDDSLYERYEKTFA